MTVAPRTAPSRLDIRVVEREGACILELSGELDIHSAPRLIAMLNDAGCRLRAEMILDLRGLTFMDSSGLKAILVAASGSAGSSLSLVRGDETIQRVFEMTGTAERLPWVSEGFEAAG